LFAFPRKETNSKFITRIDYKKRQYTIGYNSEIGPAFGEGWDLVIDNNTLISRPSKSYPRLNNVIKQGVGYILEDYEVFQVIHR
jgi:hypothetical protein